MIPKFSVKDIPSLQNRIFLVTGANTGIGLETVKQLALKDATVILAARSQEKAKSAIDTLKSEYPSLNIHFLLLDLADFKSIKLAAETVKRQFDRIDCLINNAGIMACPFALTADGIESQFGTNHVGHYLFTREIITHLMKSNEPRIINVSSSFHDKAPADGIPFDSINSEKWDVWTRYGTSKLSNMLFTRGLVKRYPNIWSYTVHPGFVNTELTRGPVSTYGSFFKPFIGIVKFFAALNVNDGALTQLYCATSKDVLTAEAQGKFYVPIAKLEKPVHKHGEDDEMADKLWEFTENLVNEKLNA